MIEDFWYAVMFGVGVWMGSYNNGPMPVEVAVILIVFLIGTYQLVGWVVDAIRGALSKGGQDED